METQEVFDTVARHLLTQKATSWNEKHTLCMYRGAEGRKCAAGILIPDEEYSRDMEGCAAANIPFFQKTFSYEQRRLIHELQRIHDNADPDFWRNKLRDLAGEYKLEFKL